MDLFDEIRPYRDHEIASVLKRLCGHTELIDAMLTFKHPWLPARLIPVARLLVHFLLERKIKNIDTVQAMQVQLVKPYIRKMIQKTTNGITWSGMDQLDPNKAYLFLSNHRDIALDPTLMNFGLALHGQHTARIAIGDNLLSKPYVSDLMRLNKSFIVKRSAETRKEKLEALNTLSAYITHSITTGHSVWLAHREGRAKDANDQTDSAIIKMLYFHHRKHDFEYMLRLLNIIPVSVSYEIDPCDFMKANELYLRATTHQYKKEAEEDFNSIILGIKGHKGHIHVAFGTPLNAHHIKTIPQCVEAINQHIHQRYQLYPINYAAYEQLSEHDQTQLPPNSLYHNATAMQKGRALLKQRLSQCHKKAQHWLLQLYANPVINQLRSMNFHTQHNIKTKHDIS